jgi:replicative DNA helicase|tara:strand:+ start:11990 stop:13348 length:1359 start_codon:yes stop_codon:yes gene_type:complete
MNNNMSCPYSKESELAVVSSVLRQGERIHEAMSLLDPEDFFVSDNRIVYLSMIDLARKDKSIDVLSIADELKNKNQYENVGGIEAVSLMEDYMPTSTSIAYHARKVKACAIKRKFITKMEVITQNASMIDDDPSAVLDEAHTAIFSLMNEVDSNKKKTDVYSPSDMAELGYKNAKARFEDPGGIAGPQTGFPLLDSYMKRLRDVNCIAASTGVGKTGLSLNIALNLASDKVPVLYINLEMNIDEIITRLLAIMSGVEIDKIDTGNYGDTPEDFKLVGRFAEKLEESTLYMTDNTPKNINHITSLIHKYHSKHDIKVVVVDYIGHIRNDKLAFKENSKRISLGRYNQMLKQVCTTLGIKLIVVAQMNRDGEKEPELSNIGECWQLAQDADTFMILHYEWIKNTDKGENVPDKFKQYIINLRKNRNGVAPRNVYLNYNERTQLMTESGGTHGKI